MQTIRVRAKERTRDISKSGAKPAPGADVVSWHNTFGRSGIRFPVDRWKEIQIVDGVAWPQDDEVTVDGARGIILESQLIVEDCEYVRDVLSAEKAKHDAKRELDRWRQPVKFIHADVVNSSGDPITDELPGQEPVFDDGYEAMTKKELAVLLDEAGLDSKALSLAGKQAMIDALRGH